MTNSILDSIKSNLGVCYDEYDPDLVMYINAALADLTIAGVGPKSGFTISGSEETWDQFCIDKTALSLVERYITTKVKISFDPPNTSFVLEALKQTAADTLYQINLKVDCPPADRDGIWTDD